MITKDSIETAYSFLHQKRNVYIHSTLDWQKDDIELAIGSYVDDMSQELYEAISDGRTDFLRDHKRLGDDITLAVERLEKSYRRYMENFEEILRKDLHQFLLSMKEVDERLPECPDVEDKWEEIAKAYIPDGIREFQDFPSASLGWMMYIGMAVAKMWDTEWEIYSKIEDLYAYMRDKRGYDSMDEYIREEVLLLQGIDYTVLEKVTGECASRVYNALMHQHLEPGTKEAFNGYVACLHQLYLMGVAMQLKRMGYHMTKMN